jgi:protein required for attachment to host cells
MKHTKTWVIVANGETARLFDFSGRGRPLVPLDDHVWHAPIVNEVADAQGVTHSSVGTSQHRLAPRNGPDKASDAFANEIAEKLSVAARTGAFEQLVIVAAPRMMGLLRDRLDTAVLAKIWLEIDKDFTQMPLEKIDGALDSHLFT